MIKPESKPKTKTKTSPTKYEGSRIGSLILLLLTVLASIAFYAVGRP